MLRCMHSIMLDKLENYPCYTMENVFIRRVCVRLQLLLNLLRKTMHREGMKKQNIFYKKKLMCKFTTFKNKNTLKNLRT